MNFEGFGDQNIKLHVLGEEEFPFPLLLNLFPNSKGGSVNCPVMQSENLGGQWDTCVPLPPATAFPSLA